MSTKEENSAKTGTKAHGLAEKAKTRITKIRDSEAGGLPSVKNEEYFHGFMPKSQTSDLLVKVGQFLVRQAVKAEAKNTSKDQFIISVRIKESEIAVIAPPQLDEHGVPKGKTEAELMEEQRRLDEEVRHLMIKYSRRARLYYIHNFGFRLASGLIEYHRRHQHPIDEDGTLIMNPVKRATWQLNHEQIARTKRLGDGAFGEVFLGTLRSGIIARIPVAVKTVVGTITAVENEKLFQEAMLMKRLKHQNIIHLVGVATNEEPLMVVMEFARGGSVEDAVKKSPPPDLYERVYYCLGAAKGLAYLEANHIIHRDIASRNVLIGSDGEAKISDFGLSLMGSFKKEKQLKKVPIPYLSPETLKKKVYTHKSDVWTYGVYIWEVFHATKPFENFENNNDIATFIKKGGRLSNQAQDFPQFLWTMVTENCWQTEPDHRPNFKQIIEIIDAQMEDFKDFKRQKWPVKMPSFMG